MTESFDIDVEGCDEGQFSGASPEHANTLLMGGGVTSLNRAGVKRSAGEREEMVMRKKLRNRESAQRARDRQKAKMRWLEEELQRMKIKNEQLLRENLILRHMVQDQAKNTLPIGGQPGLVNPLQNLPKTATPQSPAQQAFQVQLARQQAQAAQQLRQQQVQQVSPAQSQLQLIQQQQLLQQATAQLNNTNQNKKLHPNGSHDSDNSVPSVLSTGSQAGLASHTINQRGDELLKAAAAKTNQGLPNTTQTAAAQQYAAALAALSNTNTATTTTNQSLLQQNQQNLMNPAQLAAVMAQATVAAAQQSLQQQQQQQQAVAAVVQQPQQQQTPVTQQEQTQKGRPSSVGSQPSGCHTSDDDK